MFATPGTMLASKSRIRGRLPLESAIGADLQELANSGLAARCFAAAGRDARSDGFVVAHRVEIKDVQLMLNGAQFPQLRPLLGKHVRFSGSLEPAITGHHHTAVMLSDVVTMD